MHVQRGRAELGLKLRDALLIRGKGCPVLGAGLGLEEAQHIDVLGQTEVGHHTVRMRRAADHA